jgi:chorismate-pyruvate lyase
MGDMDGAPLDASRFEPEYKLKMVLAYPVIAGMTKQQWWDSSQEERDAAFRRVLDAKNLRDVHIKYLDDRKPIIAGGSLWTPESAAAARRYRDPDDAEDAQYFARSTPGDEVDR